MADRVRTILPSVQIYQRAGFVWLQVSLQSRRGEHFCGGTLVEKGNSTFIITAAHCMQHRRKSRDPRTVNLVIFFLGRCSATRLTHILATFQFRVMADDTSIAFERPPGSRRQYRSPRKVIVHPEFEEVDGTPNDIAIIIVSDTSHPRPVSIKSKAKLHCICCPIARRTVYVYENFWADLVADARCR